MFMHNGNIAYWQAIKRDLAMSVRERWFANVKGGVDSEWAFAVVLDELENLGVRVEDLDSGMGMLESSTSIGTATGGSGGGGGGGGGKEIGHKVLREAVLRAIRRINGLTRKAAIAPATAAATNAATEKKKATAMAVDGEARATATATASEEEERSLLNFALTDGDSVICTRYISPALTTLATTKEPAAEPASLYFSSGTSWERVSIPTSSSSSSASATSTDYTMSRPTRDSSTIIVASEPLTFERGDWVTVPRNSILTIRKQNVLIHPIGDDE